MNSTTPKNATLTDKKSTEKLNQQLERWKKNLIDFSKRNQLLYFKPRISSSIEFKDAPQDIFKKLVLDSKTLSFKAETNALNLSEFADSSLEETAVLPFDPDAIEPGLTFEETLQDDLPMLDQVEEIDFNNILQANKDSRALDQALAKLRTRSKASIQEQGINILYMALYFLEWSEEPKPNERISLVNQDEQGQNLKSPLILVPVSLERKGLSGIFRINVIEDEIRVNPTLAYKLLRDYGISLSGFEERIADIEDIAQLEEIVNDIRTLISKEKNWNVLDESCLSLFSFAKLSLYKDLEDNEAKILAHPVIQQISGQILASEDLGQNLNQEFLFKAAEIDNKVDPDKLKIILDADSSQEEAVLAAKAGLSFVIQGPPGTGKSQTIANIIADALSENKKILFVSEKKSALEVVVNRLKNSNLDKFCLELHNPSQKKSDIINNLKTSLEDIKSLAVESSREEYIESIFKLKAQIQQAINELHRLRQPINRTLYELYGDLANLQMGLNPEHAEIDFSIPAIEKFDIKRISELDFFFNKLATKAMIIENYDSFVWKNANVNNLSFELENSIKSNLIEFKNVLSRLETYANPISEKYFGRNIKNLKEFKWLAESCKLAISSPFPRREWFDVNKLAQIQTMTLEAKFEHEEFQVDKSKLLKHYSEKFLDLDHGDLVSKFTTTFSGMFRFLNLDYWQTIGQIKKLSLFNEARNLQTLVEDLKQAALIDQKSHELSKTGTELSLELGDFYKEFDTDWQETITAITWVQKVMHKFDSSELPSNLLEVISSDSSKDEFQDFQSEVKDLLQASELVSYHLKFYKGIFPNPNIDMDNLSFEDLSHHLENLITNIVQIEDWIEFKQIENEANEQGIKQFLDVLLHERVKNLNADNLKNIFHRKLYQLWVDKIEIENPEMRKFSGANQELLINKFIDLDEKYLQRNKRIVSKKLSTEWINFASEPANKDQVQILNQEVNKKKKHKPIRILVQEIPELLQTLKPCWMMSPLSVSQLIDSSAASSQSVNFDLVIFDEASQIRTEDAVCSIYRAKQLILAGDSNQLPPTNFFNYISDDDDYENHSFESVLDECSVFMENKTLNWHYRSRHEDLIRFSNYHIYDNQLVTFPSPITKSSTLGIDYELIDKGYYEKGTRFNRKEAQRVAEAIVEHYATNPELSLGVIAFSESQQMAIERELSKAIRKDLSIQEKLNDFLNEENTDALFIKNLENVQGDERDVIYFSIGYAKDKKGDLSHNFGPLNRDGGHRRLNVAVTRARNKLKVFTSMLSSEIDINRTSAQGALLLKKYLAYAESIANRESMDIDKDLAANLDDELFKPEGIEESIARSLEERGYKVDRYLGASNFRIDLAVRSQTNPDEYILAICTDGKIYRSAHTARDRERLRKGVLTSLGWKVHKVWARDWVKNPVQELQSILKLLEV